LTSLENLPLDRADETVMGGASTDPAAGPFRRIAELGGDSSTLPDGASSAAPGATLGPST
jgi:hypothetical protein